MFVDVKGGTWDWISVYRLCISFINPRPIALVSTISADGKTNLAPFSFYQMVCANPPVVIVCTGVRRDGRPKDTFRNIEATREFVVATVTEPIAEPMVRCGAELPYGRSEFEFAGLTPGPSRFVRPPQVAESPVNIECTLRQVVRIGEGPGSTAVVFGDIVAIDVRDEVLDASGKVCDPRKLRTVGRLGGNDYTIVRDVFEMKVPEVPGPQGR